MKSPAILIIPILAFAAAGMAMGEDRTETIADMKGSKELVYRRDALAEERSYDLKGAILEERIFDSASLPVETRSYIREGGRIVRVEAKDGSGSLIGSTDYRYDRNGRLLGISTEGSLGASSTGMIASQGMPQGTWIARREGGAGSIGGVETTVVGYDYSGRATVLESMLDGVAVSIEKRNYGEGGILSSVQLEDKVSGLSSEILYDSKGRISKRTDTPAKGLHSITEFRYDDSERLVEELSYRGGHRSSRTLNYGEDGSIAREETRRDGELLLAVVYIENGRIEELYEDGSVFVKATYLGGRKVKDEFYADGNPVRTRDY